MKGLSWNCRGHSNPLAPIILKIRAMLAYHYYDFVFLQETKYNVDHVASLFTNYGIPNFYGVDASGRSGGLFVGLKYSIFLRLVMDCKNFIILESMDDNGCFWYLCCVYGEPLLAKRKEMWEYLETWLIQNPKPFIIFGEINQVDYSMDKLGGSSSFIEGAEWFNAWKCRMNLLDVQAKGPKFTWTNKRDGNDRLFERLDKAYISHDLFSFYPDVGVQHFPIQFSDHAPIEINFSMNRPSGRRPYKIEAWNLELSDCIDLIQNAWKEDFRGSPSFRCLRKLSTVRSLLKNWSITKKNEWGKRWDDFDLSLETALSNGLKDGNFMEYNNIHDKLVEFSTAAASYWKQRAKLKWAIEGDTPSRFFFNWAKGRANANSIFCVKDVTGSWQYRMEDIRGIFRNHFESLFSQEGDRSSLEMFMHNHSSLFSVVKSPFEERDLFLLDKSFTAKEVRSAVFQLGPTKSPGPDGIPAIFYQKCWFFIKKIYH
ncbi:hypothetical protein RND81_01G096300 [Saponaria officinalis]|uniref:Endonuclease/exonuclease/phosphatase domain-containing protein n=1 Tax=Saponaria officinalis TaxID=3572 RepID=A0AAW1N9A2_SAPOF